MATTESLKKDLVKQPQKENKPASAAAIFKQIFSQDNVKGRIEAVLKDKSEIFTTTLLGLVNADENLQKCEPMDVLREAMKGAAMGLTVDKNLGYYWIIARRNGKTGRLEPSGQIGYKGITQLALRSGQYRAINVIEIYEGELVSWNRLTEEIKIDFEAKKSNAIVGFCGYFELLNGFKKTVYWTLDEIKKHKERFSKQKSENGTWATDFEAMALKTVLRNMLGRWGILSIEMQKAVSHDIAEETGEQSSLEGDPLEDLTPHIDVDYTEVNAEDHTPTEGA